MSIINTFLRALEYPLLDSFIINDPRSYQEIVLWIEHTKIRHYQVEDRQRLNPSNEWQSGFDQYLEDLACPVPWNNGENHVEVLQWLLNHAVGLEFGDSSEHLNHVTETAVSSATSAQDWVAPPIAPYLDASSPSTLSILRTLLHSLRVLPSNDEGTEGTITPDMVKRAKLIIESQIIPCIEHAKNEPESDDAAASVLSQYPLGFTTGDTTVDTAATVLRMLYIKDMRHLQDQVDAAIVRLQEITSDPRTDAAAGRVGR